MPLETVPIYTDNTAEYIIPSAGRFARKYDENRRGQGWLAADVGRRRALLPCKLENGAFVATWAASAFCPPSFLFLQF